jgi:hypothetical protein
MLQPQRERWRCAQPPVVYRGTPYPARRREAPGPNVVRSTANMITSGAASTARRSDRRNRLSAPTTPHVQLGAARSGDCARE